MPQDPESLGNGIGTLLADFVPLLPSGARRAGAARVMAARVDHDPSLLVAHPIKTQLLALGLGGAAGALTQDQPTSTRVAATAAPIALVQVLRHLELGRIQRKYDSGKRRRLAELDQEALFDDGALGLGGSSRLGAVSAYDTMRRRKYRDFGSLSEVGDAVQLAAGAVNPALYAGIIPLVSGIDNRSADRLMSKEAAETPELLPALAKSIPVGALIGALGTSTVLGAASLVTRGKSPALAKLLSGAAKDGITVFDPRTMWRLAKSTPTAARLFDKEMAILRAAEKQGMGSKLTPGDLRMFGDMQTLRKNQAELQAFQREFNASPSDVMQKAVGGISGVASAGAGAGISGLTGVHAHLSAPGEKSFFSKRADFSDQRNSPTLPLYLAAATLGSAGLGAARHWAHRENQNTPELGADKWGRLVRSLSGSNPLLLGTEGAGNAFFYKPRDAREASQFLWETAGLRDHTDHTPGSLLSFTGANAEKLRRLERYGAIIADSDAGAPTIAHEAGHAKIEETPGVLRALQRHVYPHSRWLAPLASAGSMAAGLASGSAGKGALLGTGIGALTGIGTLAPEVGASYHAMKHLSGDGKINAEGGKDLLAAISTYLAASVLPSALSGAAGGWVSGRRKKKEDEEQEKAAAVDPQKLWAILSRAEKIKRNLGADLADRHTMEHLGAPYSVARRRFFKTPEVAALGVKPGARSKTITELLKSLVTTKPAPPPPRPDAPLVQGTFDFFKESRLHAALPQLQQAKAHSDVKDYRQKSLLIRQLMDERPDDWLIDSDDGKGIVGVTHVPTGFKLHLRKDKVSPAVTMYTSQPPVPEILKSGNDNTVRDMLIGAGLGAALPAASHARYELLDRPAYRRQIMDLVEQARAEKKLFAAASSAGSQEWKNPLQRKMRLGDIILQSHAGTTFREMLKDKMPDFTTMSLGGSGSGITHAAVSTGGGRAIDPGKESLTTFKDGLLKLLAKPSQIDRSKVRGLLELRRIHPREVADAKYLRAHATDAFESSYLRPNASVVMRPDNLSGISHDKLRGHLADLKSVGYSSTDAASAGLKRLALPTRPGLASRGKADLTGGTFCSHGACTVQGLKGLKTPALKDVLPPDLLSSKNQKLVGIGVNRAALDALKGTGLRGEERLAEAARRTMLNTLKSGTNTRRILAGTLTSVLAGAGALGGLVGNKLVGSTE